MRIKPNSCPQCYKALPLGAPDGCHCSQLCATISRRQAEEEALKGTKHDAGKIQVELLSPCWLFGVGAVLTFGAKKYAAHNWRKGIEISRLLGAALRHTLSFLGGENLDPESGLCHLYHASCCLMFASELFETRPELDDRYKKEPHGEEN